MTCTATGCDATHEARGLCRIHYRRFMRNGTVEARQQQSPKGAGHEFLRWVVTTDREDCIEWPYGKSVHGYGSVFHQGRKRQAHSVALELSGERRPQPPNDNALHSCDNPPCVNPRHLRWGSHGDNGQDKVIRGRTIPGPKSAAKVAASDVRAMRDAYAVGEATYRDLAERYGLSESTISRILNRRTWTDA